MTKSRHLEAAAALAAPPPRSVGEDTATEEQSRAAQHAARQSRRAKQHARLCTSAEKVSHQHLAYAASTLMLQLIETKNSVRLQDKLIQLLWNQREHLDSQITVLVDRLMEGKRARMRSEAARHALNRDRKQVAVSWYLQHRDEFTSKDDAAEAIAEVVVPTKFRAVRRWLNNV